MTLRLLEMEMICHLLFHVLFVARTMGNVYGGLNWKRI
jgi:hypothetical protein